MSIAGGIHFFFCLPLDVGIWDMQGRKKETDGGK